MIDEEVQVGRRLAEKTLKVLHKIEPEADPADEIQAIRQYRS